MFDQFHYADWVGAVGVSLLLLAFALNVFGSLDRQSLSYSLLNVIGAGVAAYASWLIDYLPFLALEGTWCAVSLVAVITALKKRDRAAAGVLPNA